TDESGASTSSADAATISGPSRSGGVVTMIVNTTDTGERKEMFGFTARHLKRTMTSQSSPDACQQQHMKIETDGWYINLEYGLSCPTQRPPQRPGMASTGCRDRYQYKHNGPSNLGYPLIETTTMYGADGSATFTMTKEVIELSRHTIDAALNGEGVDAISLNASSASEADIEAKAKGCAYILYTDISSLKAASAGKKIGGLLGRATGVGSSDTGKSEARLDFRLIPVGSSSPTVQSSASTKEDTQEASVSSALQSEAKAVAASVNRM